MDGGLGSFGILRPVPTLCREGRTARLQLPRRRERREDEPEVATRVSEARTSSAPWEEHAHAHRVRPQGIHDEVSARRDPAEAFSDVVKRPVPQKCRAEPYSPRGIPGAQASSGSGSSRGAGARSLIGWQKSVRRIARLHRPEVARPTGERRALAGRKSTALPDAGRGWVEGETVRVCGAYEQFAPCTTCGFRLAGSEYDGRRSRVLARLAFTGKVT